jgi:opacity protein-like surface antigen
MLGGVRHVWHSGQIEGEAGGTKFNYPMKKGSTQFCAGGSVQYEICQGYFMRLEYEHAFKGKVKGICKCSSDTVIAGVGMKF